MNQEWLETDGLGGFASGTSSGIRTRRYHALLLSSLHPPTDRVVLVNGVEAEVQTPNGTVALSSQRYLPDVIHPDGANRIVAFTHEPWPTWTFEIGDGLRLQHSLFVPAGKRTVVLSWKILGPGDSRLKLRVRPLLSGRDFHALHFENGQFEFAADVRYQRVGWQPYESLPRVWAEHTGVYEHDPVWYRNFLYAEEQARGQDATEDCGSPGAFEFDLGSTPAVCIFSLDPESGDVAEQFASLLSQETTRRATFPSALHRAADAYIVQRGAGRTIIAGYPWFADWGRDTFIAMRGLCLATGKLDVARQILLEWAAAIDRGMMPNRFTDYGQEAVYNSVDAALWFVVVVYELLERQPNCEGSDELLNSVDQIVSCYETGTRHGIHAQADGLLAAGEPGVQLTWMDAKYGDWVVTPRWGKPVEIQALWYNALMIAGMRSPRFNQLAKKVRVSFIQRFWNPVKNCLYDVVDVNGQPMVCAAAIRPNQIFAVGGLPFALVDGTMAQAVVAAVDAHLLTPMGLRSLSPEDTAYYGRYEGTMRQRDGSYHQGTVWPWLLGAFVDAWVLVQGSTLETKAAARMKFQTTLTTLLSTGGLGHVSEIADGDAPHAARGCPFQAWSVGEILRVQLGTLHD